MAEVSSDLLPDLPEEIQKLLASPPVMEKKLVELTVASSAGLSPGQARMTDALRMFVITWDPLEFLAPRPNAFATANVGLSGLELVVYAPIWSLVELGATRDGAIAPALGAMAGSAATTAAVHEQLITSGRYPELVARRAVPDLLSDPKAGSALGPANIRMVSPGWEDIGLGAITDIVQHTFGPVDLDRSPVELAAVAPQLGCSACAGRRFGFPAELAEEAATGMCESHQREAADVERQRLERARASNPDGWAALLDASVRLELPHLPNGLATELAGAEESVYHVEEPGVLAARAQYVVEAAGWFRNRARDLAIALGSEPMLAGEFPDWLANLVLDLGRAGLGAQAAMVGDALARVDPDGRAFYHSDVAVALAEAGLSEEARSRVEANLARWPDNLWVRVHAGDAIAALGDRAGAEVHLEIALRMADGADDFEARSDVIERLHEIGRSNSPAARGRPTIQRPKRRTSRSRRKRKR